MAPAQAAIVTCEHCGKRNRVAVAAEGVSRCGNCHNALPWIVDADRETSDAKLDELMAAVRRFAKVR